MFEIGDRLTYRGLRQIQPFGGATKSTGTYNGLEATHFVTFDGHGEA
jgi:hypothetical protein